MTKDGKLNLVQLPLLNASIFPYANFNTNLIVMTEEIWI